MKRYIALLLAVLMACSIFVGCSRSSGENSTSEKSTAKAVDDDALKVGFILPAEGDAPDTEAREDAIRIMQKQTGLADNQVYILENVSAEKCPDQIAKLEKKGCQMIFALGARYEESVLQAAQDYEDIQFCIEGGHDTIDCGLANVHTFNSKIYEAYYAAGYISGVKLNDMLNKGDASPYDLRVGFVAYKECAETSTCINAYYLGIKEVCSQSTISVRYVGKRGNYDADGEAAKQLAESGVSMMCTYTYTTAAAAVCAEYGIPIIGNEDNIISAAPKKAIASTYTDWSVYYIEAVNAMIQGNELAADWCGGYKGGVVRLTQLNDEHVPDGLADRLMEIEKKLRKGSVKIYDTEKFTIDGSSMDTLVEHDSNYKEYKQYVSKGEFKEQSTKSAPVFDKLIDGVYISTENYLPETTEASTEETTEAE